MGIMNRLKKLTLAITGAALMAVTVHAVPNPILPGHATYTGNDNSNLSDAQISAIVGSTVATVYKSEVDGGKEAGSFKHSYSTAYFNSSNDPEDATITYDGAPDPFITGYANLWLYVKDGNHTPAYYLINISDWNGTDTLTLEDFWPNGGAISHVSILGGGTPTNRVPDAGATVMLLGAALAGLGAVRRYLA
jgi:hypothetical protein